jgi:chemotaxis protein CheD
VIASSGRDDRIAVAWPMHVIAVGIGEFAVIDNADSVLVTHALGSCVAVCIWDPEVRVAGLLHFLLPDSSDHAARATSQPAAFADTGIPLLFETAYRCGLRKDRAVVSLVGGAETARSSIPSLQIGRRNLLAARKLLWINGVLIGHETTGGTSARSVYLSAATGRLQIKAGREHIVIG